MHSYNDDIVDTILITDKKLLHFKLSKSGQILRIDMTSFPRPSHICWYIIIHLCLYLYVQSVHMCECL